MLGLLLGILNLVPRPCRILAYNRAMEYLAFVKSYDDNMTDLLNELDILCSKKQDIDAKVVEGKERLRVMTRETMNWLRNLQELVERENMKKLLKEDRVAEIVVKMMEQRGMKKLLKEDRETFDIVVQVVKKKCNQGVGDREVFDTEEDADYKKVAKIAREVMKETAEEFKKFIKEGDGAVAAVKLLHDVDLEKLVKDDDEMASILSKAEGICRKELEDNGHDGDGDQPVDKNVIKEKVRIWRKYMGSLMAFLDDEGFKNSLPDGVKLGLEIMDALSKSAGHEMTKENRKQSSRCGCCDCFGCCGCRYHHDMSKAADHITKEIKAMIGDCPRRPVTRPKRVDELENISSGFMEGLESRDKLLQKVLIALRDDQVKVVGVYGMGGAGKTTLAKEVANKRAIDLFDKRVVVEVFEAPNIKVIQDQIAEGINLPLDNVHTISQRALRIYNALKSEKKQKILIILDNIWKKLNLDEVGIPCERTKDFCCKLLITTREKQVCGVMGVDNANIFEVGLLNDREAQYLFENQIGKDVCREEYKPVVDRLLRKCGGLPLAIVATTSALKGKDLSMWCRFAEESEKPISSRVSSEYHETYSILETSFKLMENEEKRIFFFLACLSPLDLAVSVDDLMRYGIGLDLFQRVNNLSEAMKQANGWAKELVSSSLLLKDDIDGKIRIHDVVRSSAISFVEKGKDHMILVESIPRWMCKQTFKKFSAISLLSGRDFSRLSGVKAPMLQILLLKGDISSTTLASNFFRWMANLKVLSLSNIDFKRGLPTSMGQLKRLKTLHLHDCLLMDVTLISNLSNLLVLSLRGSTLEELPNDIGKLCTLRLLDIGGCKGKVNVPGNILSCLAHLEGLYMSHSFSDWAPMKTEAGDIGADNKARLSELNKLYHLNVLEMEVSEPKQLLTLSISQLVNQLDEFRIHVGAFGHWKLDKVQAFRCVLKLNSVDASQNKFLKALLKKTVCLQVRDSGSLTENFVPQLNEGGFKDLNFLQVNNCNDVRFIISPDNPSKSLAFANLEILKLEYMNNLEMICDWKAPGRSFSNLGHLTLYKLPKLTYVLPITVVPLKLVEVSIKDCGNLKFIVNENVLGPSEETMNFLFLKSIQLSGVASLSGVLGQAETTDDGAQAGQPFFHEKCAFPLLESLELQFNGTIVMLWSKTCHVSSFLNLKDINIWYCKELQSLGSASEFAALVHLEKLSIGGCDNLQEVIAKETEGYEVCDHIIVFPQLKHLSLCSSSNLKRFYGGSYKLEFPILQSLHLEKIDSLTNFVFVGSENSTVSNTLFCDKSSFPSLERLLLCKAKTIVKLMSKACHVSSFQNLKEINLYECDGLQSLGSPSTFVSLVQLETLLIYHCNNLQEVITKETEEHEVREQIIAFRHLKYLSMYNLSNLQRFYGGSYKLEFPVLEALRLSENKSLTNFVGSENSIALFSDKIEFPCLKELIVWSGSDKVERLWDWSSSGVQGESVNDSVSLDPVPNNLVRDKDDRVYVFPHLKCLSLMLPNIINFAYNPSAALHFPSLESIKLRSCTKLQSFCSGPFKAPKLKLVELGCCHKMQFFLSKNMNNIQELPSLESVEITECPMLLSFSFEVLAAPKLREVGIHDCPKIKWFSPGGPENDDIFELPCLEWVSIEMCFAMQLFSPRRIEAPKLSELLVDNNVYNGRLNHELQNLLQNLRKCTTRKAEEDKKVVNEVRRTPRRRRFAK